MDSNGVPCLQYHMDWIKRCRMQEEAAAVSAGGSGTTNQRNNTVLIPRRFDVLFGRGMAAAEHTGNLRAFHIVEMNRELYEKASKHEKTYLAEKIVRLINESYGRFLKYNKATGVWHEVESDLAREKISHYFRRLRELDSVAATADQKGKTTTTTGTSSITKRQGASSGSSISSNDATAESFTDSATPGKRFRRPSS
jgi:hypothetical protein